MSCKLGAVFLIIFGFLLASCSSAPELDAQEWPDDNDIATMIALTLTQRVKDGQQNTPQPDGQGTGENRTGEGDSDEDMLLGETMPQDTSTEENEQPVEETPTVGATETPTVEVTQQSVEETPTVMITETPTATKEEETPVVLAGIPGFNALDLVERLVGFGFDCHEPLNPSEEDYQQRCVFDSDEFRFVVTMWGGMADSIDLVEAAALYFGDLDYSSFVSVIFEEVAEISYDGSTPDEAKDWVIGKVAEIKLIGDEAVDEFGGVRYYMYALPSTQVLEIGRLPVK